jgi:hypothetical protein
MRRCISVGTLYGSPNKGARQNLIKIPAGSRGLGHPRRSADWRNLDIIDARFLVNGQLLWVRCASSRVVFQE